MSRKHIRGMPSWRVDPPNERSLKMLLTPQRDDSCPNATVLISTLVPHTGQTGRHTHPVDEIMYIISGYGEGEEGNTAFLIEPGTLILAKAGVEHNCRNLGDETMQIFCVFVPAMPDETVERIVSSSRPRPV